MATISDFRQHIFSKGVTKQNRFSIVFTLPPGVNVNGGLETLQLRCVNTDFAGYNLDTVDSRVNGTPYKSVYQKTETTTDFTFYLSRDLTEKVIFDRWKDLIVNNTTNSLSYPDDYKVDILIQNDFGTFKKTLIKAFPTATTPVYMDRTATNSIATFTATFSYQSMEDNTSESVIGGLSTTSGITTSILNGLSNILPKNEFLNSILKTSAEVIRNPTVSTGVDSILNNFDSILGIKTDELGNMYRKIRGTVDKYNKYGSEGLIRDYITRTKNDIENNDQLTDDQKSILQTVLDELRERI